MQKWSYYTVIGIKLQKNKNLTTKRKNRTFVCGDKPDAGKNAKRGVKALGLLLRDLRLTEWTRFSRKVE